MNGHHVNFIWGMTQPGFPLRLYYVDLMYSVTGNLEGSNWFENLTKEVLADVLASRHANMSLRDRDLQRPRHHLPEYMLPEE